MNCSIWLDATSGVDRSTLAARLREAGFSVAAERAADALVAISRGEGGYGGWVARLLPPHLPGELALPAEADQAVKVVATLARLALAERQLVVEEPLVTMARAAGGIVHDTVNLLGVLSNCAQLLAYRLPNGAAGTAELADLLGTAQVITALGRQFLSVMRGAGGEPQRRDLNEVVRQLTPLLRRLMPSSVKLGVELEEAPIPLEVAPAQLEQLLLNLVLNARDAVSDRGGRVTITTRHLGHEAALAVSDDGEGMNEATLAEVSQGVAPTSRSDGHGLGLSSVRAITARHRGRLQLASSPGAGTVAMVTLPVCVIVLPPPPPQSTAKADEPQSAKAADERTDKARGANLQAAFLSLLPI